MKIFYFYVILLIFILIVFFRDKKEQQTYTPIPEGILYNIETSSKTILTDLNKQITEITLYKNPEARSNLPILYMFSELKLPPKFIVRTTTKENATYIVHSATQQIKTVVYYKEKEQEKKYKQQQNNRTTEQKIDDPFVVKKKEKEIVNDFYILNNYAKNADKTYFFSGREQTLSNINIQVYSLTPYQNKSILKFQITNSQQQYFFIANVSLYTKNNNLLYCEFYNEPLVAPNKTIDCIALIPAQQKQTSLILELKESGGKGRAFSILFTTP